MYLRNNFKDQEPTTAREASYFDWEQMQKMQDAFCRAHHLYCICVGKDMGRLTDFSGTPEEALFHVVDRYLVPLSAARESYIARALDSAAQTGTAQGVQKFHRLKANRRIGADNVGVKSRFCSE